MTGEATHYPHPSERTADQWVHVVGLSAAFGGAVLLLALTLGLGRVGQIAAVSVYGACLMATFAASAAYNLTRKDGRRWLLRRFDHAAIFLMIAGSYTPFTTQRLTGWWAVGVTSLIWAAALAGAGAKLLLPGLSRRFWVPVYLAFGWVAVIAAKPLFQGVPHPALVLLLAGGLVYSAGVLLYIRRDLKFRRALWHGFVLAGAATHWVAVLTGVVLAPSLAM